MPTKIEWAEESWNPATGCTKVSEGCRNCYAERMARRLAGRYGYPEAPRHFDVTLHPDRLGQPLRWKKPRTVFVCSMSDLFHEDVACSFIHEVWDRMQDARQHTFLVLTKRPGRLQEFLTSAWGYPPLPNVGLGVTAENQKTADERREDFEATPGAFKFVSYEPALDPVDWTGWEFIDLLIWGGESGHGARPAHPNWFRNARDWAGKHGIARFMKQWGEWMGIDFDMDRPPLFDGLRFWKASSGFSVETNKAPHVDFGDGHGAIRVGKKLAGRYLDGKQWNEMPIAHIERRTNE